MRTTSIFILVLFICMNGFGQGLTVSGVINNESEKTPVVNAVVALLTPGDSVLYKFTRTDAQGKYSFTKVSPAKYILLTTHPYFADLLDNIAINTDTTLQVLTLLSKAKILQEVIIKTGSPIKIRGDTTVYTADSFKVSANANVEELLKKLPGIQVGTDGKIKAMGENVEKVLVDGEEFFGDDPGMAVKNLRADAVKEVQVFDKKSDQAAFTGIDDGKTQKTINLKLKEDKKKGYFGKADAAGGIVEHIDPRYNGNLLLSSFRGKRKISGFLLTGNVGQDGLSWEDEQKYGGNDNFSMSMDDDGGMMFMWRGTSDDEPNYDPQNGYLTNLNAGLQYSNKWNDRHNLGFSPKYNGQRWLNHQSTLTRTQVGDSVLNQRSQDNTNIDRYNFKNRITYDLKLDTNNSLKVTANANFYHTQSAEDRISSTTGDNDVLKNYSSRILKVNSDKNAVSGNLLFKHKFKKARRTVSVSADINQMATKGINFMNSLNKAYSGGMLYGEQYVDQKKDYDNVTSNISAKVLYTEPLNKQLSLEASYQLVYNHGDNNQLTYDFSPSTIKYDKVVDSLSNQFRQDITQSIPAAKINFANKKFKINIGSGFGITQFRLEDLTFNKNYDRSYINYYPSANITYTYKPNRSVRFNYSGNTKQPTITQLQPLRNNSDYFNQYIGNPDLKPSFTNSFNVSHNSYNFIKDLWMYQSMNVRLESNAITQSRVINTDSGKTVIKPVNTNGNIAMNFWGGMGVKIKKIDARFDMNSNVSFNRYATIINYKKSYSDNTEVGLSAGMNKSKEKKYDVSINNSFNYNTSTTTGSPNIHYITNNVSSNITVYVKKVWSINTDYSFLWRQKTVNQDKELNTHLLNARLQRTFSNDEFTLYLSAKDILNQNIGIERSFNGNVYTEVTNDRLKRYFMLGFTWNFKNKSAVAK